MKERPVAIRSNMVFTLNKNIVPLDTARTDGNGAYTKSGCPKRFYHVVIEEGGISSCKAAQNDNGQFYVNERCSQVGERNSSSVTGAKYKKNYVPLEEIYQIVRYYRVNKSNHFEQILITLRHMVNNDIFDWYMVVYRWKSGKQKENFELPRHGNAKKPHCESYLRHDQSVFNIAKTSTDKKSCSKVYFTMINDDTQVSAIIIYF